VTISHISYSECYRRNELHAWTPKNIIVNVMIEMVSWFWCHTISPAYIKNVRFYSTREHPVYHLFSSN